MKNFSEKVDKLLPALKQFKQDSSAKKLKHNKKADFLTKKGNKFKYTYVSLDLLEEHIEKPLDENGLMYTQHGQCIEGKDYLITTIWHIESSQWMSSALRLCHSDTSPQDQGSAITYVRRYGLAVAFDILSELDSDGATMGDNESDNEEEKAPEALRKNIKVVPTENGRIDLGKGNYKKAEGLITLWQAQRMKKDAHAAGYTDVKIKSELKSMGYDSSMDIHWKQYEEICEKFSHPIN